MLVTFHLHVIQPEVLVSLCSFVANVDCFRTGAVGLTGVEDPGPAEGIPIQFMQQIQCAMTIGNDDE